MSREDAYVSGRASAALEILELNQALNEALRREKQLLLELIERRTQLQKQQWVSMAAAGGCACLMLVCIFLWARLSQLSF
jgi:hypothetical protein